MQALACQLAIGVGEPKCDEFAEDRTRSAGANVAGKGIAGSDAFKNCLLVAFKSHDGIPFLHNLSDL